MKLINTPRVTDCISASTSRITDCPAIPRLKRPGGVVSPTGRSIKCDINTNGPIRTVAPANTYFEELTNAMALLAEHPQTVFVGQAVKYDGQAAFGTFRNVPMERRIELP